jgi:hypothetical protein
MKGEPQLPVNQEIFPVALKHLCNPAYLESIKIQTEEPTETSLPWMAEEPPREPVDSPLPPVAVPTMSNTPVKGAKTATVLGA